MSTTTQCIGAVTSHTMEYTQRWCPSRPREAKVNAAVMMIASGRGAARAFTCKQTLRLVHFRLSSEDAIPSALLQRAFSFFERGELRELRAGDPMVFDLIVNAIEQCDALESAVHSREKDDAKISAKELLTHSLEPLSIVASDVKVGSDSAFTLIARYKDTITEIDCVNRSDYGNQVLRSCKQLELLTFANGYDPSAWLGLSQLHTLCGVNLGIVTCAAIAAALPRLHTLDVFSYVNISSASMVGFFEDLLPRLRSFHFTGTWPHQTAAPRAAATTTMTAAPPQFLPVLRELVLVCRSIDLQVARGFMGAQPVLLRVPSALAVSYAKTPTITEAENGPPTAGLLSRVRNLTLLGSIDGPFDAARVLRAAPQLRTLTAVRMEGDFLLAASPEGFAGLVHHGCAPSMSVLGTTYLPTASCGCASCTSRGCSG